MGHMSGGGGGGNDHMVSHDGSEASGGHGSGQLTVLRIIIDNMMYPITVEILNKVCRLFQSSGFQPFVFCTTSLLVSNRTIKI